MSQFNLRNGKVETAAVAVGVAEVEAAAAPKAAAVEVVHHCLAAVVAAVAEAGLRPRLLAVEADPQLALGAVVEADHRSAVAEIVVVTVPAVPVAVVAMETEPVAAIAVMEMVTEPVAATGAMVFAHFGQDAVLWRVTAPIVRVGLIGDRVGRTLATAGGNGIANTSSVAAGVILGDPASRSGSTTATTTVTAIG